MTSPSSPSPRSSSSSAPPSAQAQLRKKAVRGMFWSVATGVGSRMISLASTLIVTRYVDPKSYGEVSVAFVVTQVASLVASLGVGQYVSTRQDATKKELFHVAVLFHAGGVLAASPRASRGRNTRSSRRNNQVETPRAPRAAPR